MRPAPQDGSKTDILTIKLINFYTKQIRWHIFYILTRLMFLLSFKIFIMKSKKKGSKPAAEKKETRLTSAKENSSNKTKNISSENKSENEDDLNDDERTKRANTKPNRNKFW